MRIIDYLSLLLFLAVIISCVEYLEKYLFEKARYVKRVIADYCFFPAYRIHLILVIQETFQSCVSMFCSLPSQCVCLSARLQGDNAKISFESHGCAALAFELQYCLLSPQQLCQGLETVGHDF